MRSPYIAPMEPEPVGLPICTPCASATEPDMTSIWPKNEATDPTVPVPPKWGYDWKLWWWSELTAPPNVTLSSKLACP
jgi:hypothetical protein